MSVSVLMPGTVLVGSVCPVRDSAGGVRVSSQGQCWRGPCVQTLDVINVCKETFIIVAQKRVYKPFVICSTFVKNNKRS